MFKKFLYKAQNIQLVQLTNSFYALRKGWIIYRFADFDNIKRLNEWTWRFRSSEWFNDCLLKTKEDVLSYIDKYFTQLEYRVIPVDINSLVEVKESVK